MSDQEFRNQQTKALLAVESALTDSEKNAVLMATKYLYPNMDGAGVADIIDILGNHDSHLFWTEDIFSDNLDLINKMTEQGVNPHLWSAAAQAAIMKGPVFGEVLRLVIKAQEILDQRHGQRGN